MPTLLNGACDHKGIHHDWSVTTGSHTLLPGMVDALAHLKRLVQMEFWNVFPMAENDHKDLAARHRDTLPYLKKAIHKCREAGRYVEAKNFSECMLGDLGDALVNAQPTLLPGTRYDDT